MIPAPIRCGEVWDGSCCPERRSPGPVSDGGRRPPDHPTRKARELLFTRNLQLDSASHSAFLTLNTFERGYHLKRFFRTTFHTIREKQVKNLVIDVRTNGGGNAEISTLLTRYLINRKFKFADSLYTVRWTSKYDRYIQHGRIYALLTIFTSRTHSDGFYHYRPFRGPLLFTHRERPFRWFGLYPDGWLFFFRHLSVCRRAEGAVQYHDGGGRNGRRLLWKYRLDDPRRDSAGDGCTFSAPAVSAGDRTAVGLRMGGVFYRTCRHCPAWRRSARVLTSKPPR